MRRQRTIRSRIDSPSEWPMVSDPVTLGGGIEFTNGSPVPGWGRMTPCDSQRSYQDDSTRAGSYGSWSASGFPERIQVLPLRWTKAASRTLDGREERAKLTQAERDGTRP